MNKKQIKRLIIFPSISLILICGVLVLAFSIGAYYTKTYELEYQKVITAQTEVELYLLDMKETQLIIIHEILEHEGFYDVFQRQDRNELKSIINAITTPVSFEYGYVTDGNGTVILRTHNSEHGDDISGTPQIIRALRGDTTSSAIGGDDEPVRIVTTCPIYDRSNENIIGAITIGRTLNTRAFADTLKKLTGCEVTLFVGTKSEASTLTYPSLDEISDDSIKEQIVSDVLVSGNIYSGILDLYENDFISIIKPITGISNEPFGMLWLGSPATEANTQIFNFILRGAIVTFSFIAIASVVSVLAAKFIINRIEAMEEHTRNRDMLFEAVNKASFILLEIDETDDIRMPLVSAMEYIGLAFAIDHVHLWRYKRLEDDTNQFVREYSWVSEYAKLKAGTPKYINSSGDGVLDSWMAKFMENEIIRGIVANMEPGYQKVISTLNAKSIAMMPIFLEEQFWGMFTIDNMQNPKDYTDDEVYILRSISLMMANIVRRHDLQNENLKVYYDALTGINNRRYFDKTMARIISSMSRAGNELGLMMIDVDYFKKYNDTYGHGAGDECLIRVAEILAQSANRIDDFVARYGGEEFVVVMPNTDMNGAMQVAHRMNENIRAAKIPHEASDVAEYVTVSIGVTTGKVTHHHTPEIFVKRADDMLYKSKHEGRNRATYGELEEVKT